MNKYVVIYILTSFFTVMAATKKVQKTNETSGNEKIYQVSSGSSELEFTSSSNSDEIKRVRDFWYVAISRSSISYDLPSFVPSTSSFDQQAVGVTLGKKQFNHFWNRTGLFEYSLEWQNFTRDGNGSLNTKNSQSLNILQLNFYQNFLLARALKNSLFISAGGGFSPLVATIDQSAISDSATNLGILFTPKINFDYPIKKNIINTLNYFAIDLELALSLGRIGNQQISMSSIKLGSNFNW